MAGKASRKRKKSRVLPVTLLFAAALSLVIMAMVYSPEWVREEGMEVVRVFHIPDSTPPPDTVFIQVKNGAGVADLAMKAQNFLETRSGEVVFHAPGPPLNAPEMDYEVTIILSHDTSYAGAMSVAGVLGLGDSSVVMLLPPEGTESLIDVTVILGRDRDDPACFIPYRD